MLNRNGHVEKRYTSNTFDVVTPNEVVGTVTLPLRSASRLVAVIQIESRLHPSDAAKAAREMYDLVAGECGDLPDATGLGLLTGDAAYCELDDDPWEEAGLRAWYVVRPRTVIETPAAAGRVTVDRENDDRVVEIEVLDRRRPYVTVIEAARAIYAAYVQQIALYNMALTPPSFHTTDDPAVVRLEGAQR